MNLFCEEVHKLEAEFKQCRKLLNAIGDENRQHLICVMMNMPIDGGLILEIVEQTHHPGCHSLICKVSARNDYAEKALKNAEKKGCKLLNGLGMSSSRGLLSSNYGPDRRLHWM